LPAWLFRWLSGIVAAAEPGQFGVLVLRRPRTPRSDALVCVRWKDWVALHGAPLEPVEGEEPA
jgi:hypothetical protein